MNPSPELLKGAAPVLEVRYLIKCARLAYFKKKKKINDEVQPTRSSSTVPRLSDRCAFRFVDHAKRYLDEFTFTKNKMARPGKKRVAYFSDLALAEVETSAG